MMIVQINSMEDVKTFVTQLIEEGLNYHPDDDFSNYINLETVVPSYTPEEAEIRNRLNERCFEICENYNEDIYDISMEIFLKQTGLDKFIPLPSQSQE